MTAVWRRLAMRFDALVQRMRLMLAAGLFAVIALLGHSFLLEPQLQRQANADKRASNTSAALVDIETALAEARTRRKDPAAGKFVSLEEIRTRTQALDARLRDLSGNMVPPDKMPVFLESLLARNPKLELLSLRTLPLSLVVEANAGEVKGLARPSDLPHAPNMYKHGLELRIAGSYGDLLAYLEELERTPQRILWGSLTLTVERFPRSVLTLRVYTVSLDKQWLVV